MKIKTLIQGTLLLAGVCLIAKPVIAQSTDQSQTKNKMETNAIHYQKIKASGLNIFYREAGPKDAPVVLLLHGYPTSSHMFRNLIPILSSKYHVIAPDLPGFGYSDAPKNTEFNYTFDHITEYIQGLVDLLDLKKFALYVFDYGAPV